MNVGAIIAHYDRGVFTGFEVIGCRCRAGLEGTGVTMVHMRLRDAEGCAMNVIALANVRARNLTALAGARV